ncbi:MAG: iron-sulfur cluster assembly accessory protein [Robiginitomaculum sp.]|nr:iron-sulfur cluster assembly accessory protein [Robiginitomaculum sp.]
MTRIKPQIVNLTEKAASRVKELLVEKQQGFLRVGVKNGGCAGMEYTMDYVAEAEALDETVTDKDVTILVDAAAVLFLLGSTIDYEVEILHSKFVFKNPNETDACGCGISVTIEPAVAL